MYHQYNQSITVTDRMTVTSLAASLQHKTQVATDHVGQTTLNQKLSCIVYAKL